MTFIPCILFRVLAAIVLASLALPPAAAQQTPAWPARPIRIVVPFTPGGSTDILARAIGKELQDAWGQPVVIDNVPGAGGSIGADRVAKAQPDGYTLLMGHIGTLAVNPSLYPNLPYDPVKSFAPVAWVARVPNVLVVHPSVPARTVQELVALAKSRPGQLAYGSGGNGSAANLATEYFKLRTGTSLLHIPYRGTAPAITDLIGGQLDVIFSNFPESVAHVKSGKLRALAIASSTRHPLLPDVPTTAEAGVPQLMVENWTAIMAPAGTPEPVVAKLAAEVLKIMAAPDMEERARTQGFRVDARGPQAFGKFLGDEVERWQLIIAAARITAE